MNKYSARARANKLVARAKTTFAAAAANEAAIQ
jgi:hypothetical protein